MREYAESIRKPWNVTVIKRMRDRCVRVPGSPLPRKEPGYGTRLARKPASHPGRAGYRRVRVQLAS